MTSRARSWLVLGVLGGALACGTLAALSAVASSKGLNGAVPARTSVLETILCAFVPIAAPAGFYTEMASAHARMHQALEAAAPTGDPDRDFAQSMIPHHQGAIDMALIQLKYGRDERLRRRAQAILVDQGQEIAYLRTLLDKLPATDRPDRQ